jgi:hypothetical protein
MNTKQRSSLFFCSLIITALMIGVALPEALMASDSYTSWRRGLPVDVQYVMHPLFRMTLVTIVYLWLRRLSTHRASTLGLLVGWRNMLMGLGIGLACSLPMLVVGLLGTPRDDFDPRYIAYSTLMPGITEEIFYRAFAFGLLVQLARWRVWPAAIFTGIVFGLAHVDFSPAPGQTIAEQFGLWIAMIALGGVMYAWLYERARWNLWPVIGLHFAMNLWWDTFDLTSSPLGAVGATLSRIACVGYGVLFIVHPGLLREGWGLPSNYESPERSE